MNEAEVLQSFKTALVEKGLYNQERHDDSMLFRFLRARTYVLHDSLVMFENCEKWREEMNVEDMVLHFKFNEVDKVAALYPRFYHKVDKVGRAVYIEQFKHFDYHKLLKVTTIDRLEKHTIRGYEKCARYRLKACALKANTNIEQCVVILDLEKAPLSQFNQVRSLIQRLSAVSSNYYPESLGKMFVINAPYLFTFIWSIVSNFLDEVTASKIAVLGTNYKKHLLEHIEAENLPRFIGGKCKCPGGCAHSDIGPWNDGSVKGYPIEFWEDFLKRDRDC